MKFVIASDSFKGSLSSKEIISIFSNAANKVFPNTEVIGLQIADGGEGTLDALSSILKYDTVTAIVKNESLIKISADFLLKEEIAIIEVAKIIGISNPPKNSFNLSSYGVGELILEAINKGAKTIYLALGGSATNDGGIGALSALGLKLRDASGHELPAIPKNLNLIKSLDTTALDINTNGIKFIIMSDVQNVFTGDSGATFTYGKQKGASESDLEILENGLINFSEIIINEKNIDLQKIPGSGAAGGLAGGLSILPNATIVSGINTILDIIDFKTAVKDADIVFTGEGRIDWQSAYGKVPVGVATFAKEFDIPVIAIVGAVGDNFESLYDYGIDAIFSTTNRIINLEEAIKNSKENYYSTALNVLQTIKIGHLL